MLVLEASKLFDGTEVIEDVSVLIKNGTVLQIGRKGEFRGKQIDVLESEFAMPGLIDMHVHIAGYSEELLGDPFKVVKKFLKLLIYNGVTAVREVGNSLEPAMFARFWSKQNPAPMVFSSGPLLDMPPATWPFTRLITSTKEAKLQVEKLYAAGVDLIKVYVNVEPEILRSIIDEAHGKGLKVAGHLEATSVLNAVDMGIDSIEHVFTLINKSFIKHVQKEIEKTDRHKQTFLIWDRLDLNSELINVLTEKLAKNDVFVCPTLVVTQKMVYRDMAIKDPNLDHMVQIMPYHKYYKSLGNPFFKLMFSRSFRKYDPFFTWTKEDKKMARRAFDKMLQMTKILSDKGVKIIAGTDTPNPFVTPGFSLHEELKLLVKAGLTPTQALISATSRASKFLERNDIGVIKPKALANILLIDGDPSTKIDELSQIRYVILNGKPYKRDDLLKEPT